MILVVEVIPYRNFREKLRITKAARGKVTVESNYIIIERVEEEV
jgi:hypothetical protein